jgi:hypothetical protein
MNRFLLSLLLLSSWLLSPIQAQQPENNNSRIVTFDWFANSGSASPFQKKQYLLVLGMPAQSNMGTIDQANQQETGSVPFADQPVYLQTAPSNVYYVQQAGAGVLNIAQWSVPASLEWGWFNQYLYVVSSAYTEVMFGKKSLGGSDILPGNLGLYPRSDARGIALAAINGANTRWGAGNYNVVYLCDIGESNAANATNANAWQPAMVEFVDNDLRVNRIQAPIIVIKKGRYQVIDFPAIVTNLWAAQDAYVALDPDNNYIVSGSIPGGGGGWELQDVVADDFSHYNSRGSIAMGNGVADMTLYLFGGRKIDRTKPVLQTAVINSGAPSQIVLTYSESLNSIIVPFWKDFTIGGTRKVINVAVSGSTVTLTASENFYSGQSYTLSYTKKQFYEHAVCDLMGNEADDFTSISVTNNSATATPTYTRVYTSNFSAGTDSWGGSSGGTVASVDGIGGLDDVLEMGSTDTTPLIFRSATFTNATDLHRVRLKVFVPVNLISANPSNDYALRITGSAGGLFGNDFYQYIRRNVLGGQWVDIEFTAVPTGSGSIRLDFTCTIGDRVWFRDILVDRLN